MSRSRKWAWLAAPAMLAAVLAPMVGSSSAAAGPPSIQGEGTYLISTVTISPGQTRTGGWNNTPQGRSYFIDVRPSPTQANTSCVIDIGRERRVRHSPSGELEAHWSITNAGLYTCDVDVYLAYVTP